MSDAACHAAGGAAGTDAAANGIDAAGAPDRLLRKAETILAGRTERILLVLERCTDNQNYLACLRTAESLGGPQYQHVANISHRPHTIKLEE